MDFIARILCQIRDILLNILNAFVIGNIYLISVHIGDFGCCGIDVFDEFICVNAVLDFLAYTFYRQSFVSRFDCKFYFISIGNCLGSSVTGCFQFPRGHTAYTLCQSHFFFELLGVERISDILLVIYRCGESRCCSFRIFGFRLESNRRFVRISQCNVCLTACRIFYGKSAFKIVDGCFHRRYFRIYHFQLRHVHCIIVGRTACHIDNAAVILLDCLISHSVFFITDRYDTVCLDKCFVRQVRLRSYIISDIGKGVFAQCNGVGGIHPGTRAECDRIRNAGFSARCGNDRTIAKRHGTVSDCSCKMSDGSRILALCSCLLTDGVRKSSDGFRHRADCYRIRIKCVRPYTDGRIV